MKPRHVSNVAEIVVMGAGFLLLFLGLWSFANPQIFSYLYGIDVTKPSTTIALRAMIGGGEIGLGLFLFQGKKFGVPLRSRLLLTVFLFACVFFARVVAVILDSPEVSSGTIRELAIEGTLAGAFVTLLCQIRRSTRDNC